MPFVRMNAMQEGFCLFLNGAAVENAGNRPHKRRASGKYYP